MRFDFISFDRPVDFDLNTTHTRTRDDDDDDDGGGDDDADGLSALIVLNSQMKKKISIVCIRSDRKMHWRKMYAL